jgi:hypothetical protein
VEGGKVKQATSERVEQLEELCSATWHLLNLLNASIGTNADWPIRVNTDNQKDADTLCHYMNLVERCLKTLGMPVKKKEGELGSIEEVVKGGTLSPTPDPFEAWWDKCTCVMGLRKDLARYFWDAAIRWKEGK